jgi:hypothetical protein
MVLRGITWWETDQKNLTFKVKLRVARVDFQNSEVPTFPIVKFIFKT